MNTERINQFKTEIASSPVTPERLIELAELGTKHQQSIAGDLRLLFDESAEITKMLKPLVTLWQLTKPEGSTLAEPAIISLDPLSADLEINSPRKHLMGNLKWMTLNAAEVEVSPSRGGGPSRVVHIDAVYDRLVTMLDRLVADTGHNTTALEILSKWKSPKSAIASVLHHSKDWNKVRKGEYERV